jgi:hypothetical protein
MSALDPRRQNLGFSSGGPTLRTNVFANEIDQHIDFIKLTCTHFLGLWVPENMAMLRWLPGEFVYAKAAVFEMTG